MDFTLKKKRGFTLIELLVVIAIIGILSAVVLSALNVARGKGSNAAVKSNLGGIRGQAELFYNENNGFYDNLCVDPKILSMLDAASLAGAGNTISDVCNNNSSSWAVSAPLKVPDSDGSTFWCIDNAGSSKGEMAALGGALSCP